MNLKQHFSGSKGNLYTLEHEGQKLLLECGVPESKIREAVDFTLHEYCGCLITHEHQDHAFAAWNVARAGVPVFASKGTMDSYVKPTPYTAIKALVGFTLGCFSILPFDVEHDAAEPLGFLIQAGDEKLLFATDTCYLKYKFEGLTQLAIECNWSEKTLSDEMPFPQIERIKRSHMSLERLIKMLKANDLSLVKKIHLLHISSGNGDSGLFVSEVQELTGIPTYCIGG